MKITYLGQAGFLFETEKIKIMIDPYLSNSVEKIEPHNKRRVPVDERFFEIKPDVMVFTHDHLDHYDPETAGRFIREGAGITVLSPRSVFDKVRRTCFGNNYVLFDNTTEWTEKGVTFTATKAVHSDTYAIGVIIDDGEKKYYITGDTLYSESIFESLPDDIYAVFLPVNGVGNNMNMSDAARFAKKTRAKKVVPMHIGLFDEKTSDSFECDNKVKIKIYEEVEL
jgi:L-ascorbate metabolism protein UlaG (beta-lactamase superfamily)